MKTPRAIPAKINKSVCEIPRTEPNKMPVAAELAVCPSAKKRIPKAMAKADTAEVTLSWRTLAFSNPPIDNAAKMVKITIPKSGGQPIKKPKAAPAKAISLKEWLKKLYERATTKVPTIPATIEITVPAIKAFCIKTWSNMVYLLAVLWSSRIWQISCLTTLNLAIM